jgi:hypothetical protein
MATGPVRWGVRGLLGLALGVAVGFGPVFNWMAPVRVGHSQPERSERGGAGRLVVLISIDGLAPGVLANSDAPNLGRFAREGTAAREARTVVPSITLTAHTSMISGVAPSVHGVLFNRYQPWSRIEVPTLFGECRSHALGCGMMAGKRKFAHFAETDTGIERFRYGESATAVLRHALDYVKEAQPDFVMVHLAEVDLAGHDEGWGSDAQRERIAEIDTLLGFFVLELRELTDRPLNLIITADHGGSGTTHGSAEEDDVRIPWILWGDAFERIDPDSPVLVADTAATVLSLLGVAVPPGWTGRALAQPAP